MHLVHYVAWLVNQRGRGDSRRLRPSKLSRLVNSSPLGTVLNERQRNRHRSRAGFRVGNGRHVDLFRYAAWLDDIYLPWHLEAMAAVFQAGYQWSLPADVGIDRKAHLERKKSSGLFHGSRGFTRKAFLSVGAILRTP